MGAEHAPDYEQGMIELSGDFSSYKKSTSYLYTREGYPKRMHADYPILLNYCVITERHWLRQQQENEKEKPHDETKISLQK